MEYKMKCNVCGKYFCFTDEDLSQARSDATVNLLSGVGQIASAFAGSSLNFLANKSMEKDLRDFTKCPFCGSKDIIPDYAEENTAITNIEIKKLESDDKKVITGPSVRKNVEINPNATVESLLKRTQLFLEEGDWDTADAYCENILDADPTNSAAYIFKTMVDLKVNIPSELFEHATELVDNANYSKAIRFADDKIKPKLYNLIAAAAEKKKNEKNEKAERIRVENERWEAERKALQEPIDVLNAQKAPLIERLDTIATRYKEEIASLNKTISDYSDKKKNLGLFAGKQKKEIDSLIQQVYTQIARAEKEQEEACMPINDSIREIDDRLSIETQKYNAAEQKHFSNLPLTVNVSSLHVGDIYKFGRYQQDNSSKDAIAWRVISISGHYATLASDKIIDAKRFNDKNDTSWAESELRTWLNESFYNEAFNNEEKQYIASIKFEAAQEEINAVVKVIPEIKEAIAHCTSRGLFNRVRELRDSLALWEGRAEKMKNNGVCSNIVEDKVSLLTVEEYEKYSKYYPRPDWMKIDDNTLISQYADFGFINVTEYAYSNGFYKDLIEKEKIKKGEPVRGIWLKTLSIDYNKNIRGPYIDWIDCGDAYALEGVVPVICISDMINE